MDGGHQFVDLTHHLSPEVLARKVNPLKEMIRYVIEHPNVITLANGDPHPSLYPVRRVDYEVFSVEPDDLDPVSTLRSLGASAPTRILSSTQDESSTRLLKESLQYGHGAGLRDVLRVVKEITDAYHTAPHHVATMSLGNADSITKVFRMLGSPGDHFLADEFTFGPMPLAAEAHGIRWVAVRIDKGGIVPEDMERILEGWDERRGRRPHVLYTTPCGQNPTGSTLSLERRERIYALAQKYDIVIVEDDPYYFLQYDTPHSAPSTTSKPKQYAKSLLSMDVDGRVIRLDSFSKIMAPGLRLGWVTSTPAFHDHLVRFIDLSSQNPAGFSQVLVTQLLGPGPHGWQLAGFDRWVRSMCRDYQRRRDFFMGLFEKEVKSTGFASAEVPEAGMFVWIRVLVEKHPRFRRQDAPVAGSGSRARTNGLGLMQELIEMCLAEGLAICPATLFSLPGTEAGYDEEGSVSIDDRSNFLRATFAGTEEVMSAGLPILGRALKAFFADAGTAKAE